MRATLDREETSLLPRVQRLDIGVDRLLRRIWIMTLTPWVTSARQFQFDITDGLGKLRDWATQG